MKETEYWPKILWSLWRFALMISTDGDGELWLVIRLRDEVRRPETAPDHARAFTHKRSGPDTTPPLRRSEQ